MQQGAGLARPLFYRMTSSAKMQRSSPADKLRCLEVFSGNLASTRVCHCVEAHLLTFSERVHSCPLKRSDVNKHIRPAIVRLNEAKAFIDVEEFYRANSHSELLVACMKVRPGARAHARCIDFDGKSAGSADGAKTKFGNKIDNALLSSNSA